MEAKTIAVIATALFAISEALSLIPALRANGIFQVIWNVLKVLAGKKNKEA
ncbi:hypothetical protein ES707_08067 [subsurface metagenome]